MRRQPVVADRPISKSAFALVGILALVLLALAVATLMQGA